MSWLLDAFLIVFLLAVVVYWSTQGFFSALLHLVAVIAASVLAVAIWEPLVVGVLLGRMPAYAWGVGLLCPFALFLIIIRKVSDKLIANDLQVPNMANVIGGGSCGLASGVLTAGMLLIGIGFLPLPSSILGYKAYGFGANGQVKHTKQHLIVPVESITSSFLGYLAHGSGFTGGAFTTGTPLAMDLPNLAAQSGLYRVRLDPNASLVATPESVSITGAYKSAKGKSESLPVEIEKAIGWNAGSQLYMVDTTWKMTAGVFDGDHTLRINRGQIHLITKSTANGVAKAHLIEPAAWTLVTNKQTGARTLVPFGHKSMGAYIVDDGAVTGWVFVFPKGQTPQFLEIRRLRFSLPGKSKPMSSSLLGTLWQPPKEKENGPPVGERQGIRTGSVAKAIKQTNSLPQPFRKSMASGLSYSGKSIKGGKGTAKAKRGGVGQRTVVNSLYLPKQKAMIRLEITSDQAQSFFGRALAAAANVSPPLLHTRKGEIIAPSAYVWVNHGGQEMTIDYPFAPFQSGTQIPFTKMNHGDKIYLYFMVNHGIDITKYSLSADMHQSINLHVK